MFPAALSRASNGYIRRILIVGLAVLMLVATLAIAPGGAIADDTDAPVTNSGFVALAAPVAPVANPDLPANACGLNVALVMDSSGSIGNSGPNMYAAYKAILAGLDDTGSWASVVDFDDSATLVKGWTEITNPDDFDYAYSVGGWTNWQAALDTVPRGSRNPDLVVMLSDGNPNRPGSDFLNQAITAANTLKSSPIGAHMLGVAIGPSITVDNMKAITDGAASQLAPPANIVTDIRTLDVITSGFNDLEDAMRKVASALCDGSVTVTKHVDGAAASGWEFSASPQPGSISPADATTGANGEVTFSWKLVDPTTKSVSISEILQSGFLFDSYSCSDGSSSDDSTDLTAELTVEQGKNIRCTFENATVQPSIEIEKLTNGQDADTVPGPYIAVDDAVTWTYKVKNTGNVILTDVGVTDSQGVAVSCPKTTLEIDASMTCTASGIAVAGQYSNIGTATAKDPTGGTPSDEDTSHYYGVDAGIEIEKLTNGQDADTVPGPYIAVDDAVTWTYKVKNTGNVILTDVGVTDSQGVAVSCPKTTLEIDASMTCTASGIAVAGQYSNIGTATAKDPTGGTPSDEDTSHYYGVDAGIEIEKLTNGQDADTVPGPYIAVDDAVTWTYKVKNTGNVILTDVGVTDSQGVAVSCPKTTLEIDASMTCTASGIAVAGQYSNIGTATAKDPTGGTPSDEDTSHYYGVDAGIEIEKLTNGQDADTVPGPYIAVDDAVTWTYKVKNTGNVILTDVGVTDSQGVAVSCPKTTLEIDASMTCTASGIAVAGQYSNIGTAAAKDPTGGTPSDEDTSHYYGVDAGIEIEKLTNGQDADTVPGPYIAVDDAVTWTYLVQATGNTPLANVVVTDSQGVVPVFSPASDANSNGLLDPGEIWVYKATGVAVAGQYSNIGTATAKDPAGGRPADNDPSHYYGVEGDLTLEKATNGQDADTPIGPYVPVGGAVTWTYVVTNGSNAAVSDIAVTDDVLGAITCSADMLAAGASMTCTATGAAEAGQYANIGEVAGIDAAEGTVGDTDPSHYYGVTAGIDIEKYSNGEQADIPTGPYVAADDPVTWTYLVQNTGNAPLAKVVVTDNQGVIPVFSNGDDNTNGLLDPGEIWVYEATGVAVAGQYSNIGTATAEDPTGGTAGDTDPSHYYGVEPGISLVKTGAFGIGDDVIATPGDVITYEFVVKNTGNVSLDTINVEDLDLGGINVSCPTTELAVGASMTCTADYPVTQEDINAGTVENCAVASGLDPLEADVSDKDCTETDIPQSPAIGITKSVAPTPINVGEATEVTWTIVVTNTGNVPLHAVTVSDALVPACDAAIGDLAIGGSSPQLTCRSIHTPDSLAWTFTNVAVAAGLGPLDTQVSATADARIDPIQTLGTAQLGDTVWQDLDKDGVQDSGEPGINGAKVILKDSTGATIATATTAKGPWDGWYKFVGLDAGRYAVTLDLSSVSGQLTTAGSYTIDLAGGEEFLDADFGVAETLPKTGLEAEQLTLLAIALLAAGAFAVLASRRRKTDN